MTRRKCEVMTSKPPAKRVPPIGTGDILSHSFFPSVNV